MKKELKMVFQTRRGANVTFTLDNPKVGLTKEEIEAVMQVVIDKNIFETVNGELTSLVNAKVVETDETVYDYSK